MRFFTIVTICALSASALADGFQCPNSKNRKYAHHTYCDRYWDCRNGVATEGLCADGLVFDSRRRPGRDPCDNSYNVDCGDLELFSQEPQQVHPNCPRLNGIFAHPDPTKCHVFSSCKDGVPTEITCSGGLVWSPRTGTCTWETSAHRDMTICKRNEKLDSGFTCPPGGAVGKHTRHVNPLACDSFYLCLNGIDPRLQGCDKASGFVYNEVTEQCEDPSSLPTDHVCYEALE